MFGFVLGASGRFHLVAIDDVFVNKMHFAVGSIEEVLLVFVIVLVEACLAMR